jgi:hypothetical protein
MEYQLSISKINITYHLEVLEILIHAPLGLHRHNLLPFISCTHASSTHNVGYEFSSIEKKVTRFFIY